MLKKIDAHNHAQDFASDSVKRLREDLALALRAAAHHGLAEGVCNHFSVELPDDSRRFLLNPRGLLWQEIGADDIVMIDEQGNKLAGRHEVEIAGHPLEFAVRVTANGDQDTLGEVRDGQVVGRRMGGLQDANGTVRRDKRHSVMDD